jgi:dihydrofolate reductase
MTKVTAQMSVSLDGYYAGPQLQGDGDWMASAEAAGFFRVTQWVLDALAWRERLGFAGGEQSTNSDIVEESFTAAGAYVMGRRMADGGQVPWGEEPPFHAPVFVVTNRPHETLVRAGGTSFTYVTDGLAAALERARAAANGKNVAVAGGGRLLRRLLVAGLLDELELHVAPVVLGAGMSLFDDLGLAQREAIELTPVRTVHTAEVTHLRYTVGARAALGSDERLTAAAG